MKRMGLGPPVIELYRQLKIQGALDDVTNVMELGSQDFWCPQQNLIKALFQAFGRPEPDPRLLTTSNTQQQPARLLYEALGISYNCVDIETRPGTLVLDMNFDKIPETEHNQYGLVTNHGTSEHILNQYNVFEMMHDLTKPGGVMVHAVPFTVNLGHGFFNYQPNFFESLARYNSYETLGLWVGPGGQLTSFIPWDPLLLDYLTINSKSTHLLIVAQRKMYEKAFCVPFQEIYEHMMPDEVRTRYSMVIDGEVLDSKRVKYLTKDEILAREYNAEIINLKDWITAYRGEIDALKNELSVTKHHFDQLRYGPPPEPYSSQIASLQQEMAELETTRQQQTAELEAARQQEKAELEAARAQEKAELEAARQQERAELEAARQREIAELEAARQREIAELEAARQHEMAEFEAARQRDIAQLEEARQLDMAELQATRQREIAELEAARQAEVTRLEAANIMLLNASVDRTKALHLAVEFCRRVRRRLAQSVRPS